MLILFLFKRIFNVCKMKSLLNRFLPIGLKSKFLKHKISRKDEKTYISKYGEYLLVYSVMNLLFFKDWSLVWLLYI